MALFQKIILAAVFAAYFFFGLSHLGQFVTADEHYWTEERIPEYWDAVRKGKWKKTYINDKPGVSVALISGGGLLFADPKQHLKEQPDKILTYDTGQTTSLYTTFRLPILIVNGCLLFFLFRIIRTLYGPWIALWTVTLTALSPITLGISQIVNPDALLWSFGVVATFSFLALLVSSEKKYLILTALFTGFALLSKYVALILLPLFGLLILCRFFSSADPASITELKKNILSLAFITVLAAGLFCLFLPAAFLDGTFLNDLLGPLPHKTWLFGLPLLVITALLIDTFLLGNRVLSFLQARILPLRRAVFILPCAFLLITLGLIASRLFFPEWDIFRIPFDIKDITNARYYTDTPGLFETLLLEWHPLVFSLTPITLLSFVALLVALLTGTLRKKYAVMAYVILLFFAAYILLFVVLNVLATPRYAILLYPFFAFLGALGIVAVTEKYAWPHKNTVATIIVFAGSFASLVAIRPFYLNYANALLPKDALVSDAWGYGGYEAAQYLNTLPDAENITVWADYYGVCEFFVGRCLTAYTFDPTIVKPDYYVLTRRGQIRYMSRHTRWERLSGLVAYKYYDVAHPEWKLEIDDRPANFIKIVRVEK